MFRRLGRIGLVSGGVSAALLVTEFGLRIAGIGDPVDGNDLLVQWDPGSPYELHADTPGVTFRPGFAGAQVYRNAATGAVVRTVPVRISPEGLRGEAAEAERRRPRVLGVGDSVTFGQGVEEDQTFLAELERQACVPVEVLNAGVPSWSLEDEVAWVRSTGWRLAPDLLVVATYVNDVAKSPRLPPEGTDRPILAKAPTWAQREVGIRKWSYLINLGFRTAERRRLAREFAAPEPSRRSPTMSYLDELRQALATGDAGRHYADLRRTCDERGLACAVALLPVLVGGTADPGTDLVEGLAGLARDAGLVVVRVDDALADVPEFERYVFPADRHPGPAAHAAIGQALAQRLPLVGLAPGVPGTACDP